ncbi:MAG: putative bifunctional diguanylate cyclase/phosphodiesterase [Actinomycetota bacterium]
MSGTTARGGTGRIYALAGVLGLSAVGLTLTHLRDVDVPEAGLIPWLALLIAFAVTEMFPVHLEHRREAVTLSLSTIPLVVGLFTVSPVMLIAARVIGALVVLVVRRRQRPYKLAVNLTMFWLETAAAALVFHAIVPHRPLSLASWPAAFAGAFAADLVSTIVIVTAISLFQGHIERGILRSTLAGTAVAVVDAAAALLVMTLLVAQPAGLGLLALVVAPLIASYRLYSSLREQHGHLGRLHDLTSKLSGALDSDDVVTTLLAQARDLVHAETAWIQLAGEPGGDVTAAALLPASQGMVAPLNGPTGRLGALYVGERSGDVRAFLPEDLRLLETVANHASVSLGNSRLVAQLREQAATSNHQSMHDSLTGLPNRMHFHQAVDARVGEPGLAAVLLLDLDRFKEVNDTLGHQNGDLLLCEVGKRLCASLRAGDVVSRLGGDEFAILLPDVASESSAIQVGHSIVRALEQRFDIADVSISVGASIGIALSPDHGDSASKLLQLADVAMYTAKADQSGVELYDPGRDDHTASSLALVSDLREAIDRGVIEVHYQPQVDLRSGRVLGVEALARWEHPRRGWVAPDEFVATAERAGLIRPLTTLVLARALAQCAEWRAAGHDLRLSVNLSARSLLQATLPEDIGEQLRVARVPASALCLELTETSMLVEPRRTVDTLHRLRDLGVTIAIDDFGTGHSSLGYLKDLPVGEIKIDRSFVSGMREDRFDEAIVCSIIDLARHLLIPVVAEGIEDDLTAQHLSDVGCAFGQGYAFARALPAAELDSWLSDKDIGELRPAQAS